MCHIPSPTPVVYCNCETPMIYFIVECIPVIEFVAMCTKRVKTISSTIKFVLLSNKAKYMGVKSTLSSYKNVAMTRKCIKKAIILYSFIEMIILKMPHNEHLSTKCY